MKNLMEHVEAAYLHKMPKFRVGDQVRVHLKIVEGDNERVQVFEGTVIAQRGHGTSNMFTVRKISFGIGVERTIPLYSPRIEKIEVLRSGHVRRAKLYFLRALTGRAARLEEKVDLNRVAAASATAAAKSATPAQA